MSGLRYVGGSGRIGQGASIKKMFAFNGRYLDMLQECCLLLIALMLTYLGMFKVLLLHGL